MKRILKLLNDACIDNIVILDEWDFFSSHTLKGFIANYKKSFRVTRDKNECNFILRGRDVFFLLDENALKGLTFMDYCAIDYKIYKDKPFEPLMYDSTCKFVSDAVAEYDKSIARRDVFYYLYNKVALPFFNSIDLSKYGEMNEGDISRVAVILGLLSERLFGICDNDVFNECEVLYDRLIDRLNSDFQVFIKDGYSALSTASPYGYPYRIDKVQHYIKNSVFNSSNNKRVAFIVLDGMNIWQWVIVKNALEREGLKDIRTLATLTRVPSITRLARYSVFSGKRFSDSDDNRNEGRAFIDFWESALGIPRTSIHYSALKNGESEMPGHSVKVASYVATELDGLLHSNIFGNGQLYSGTKGFIGNTKFTQFVKHLKDEGFTIYITSDHGNICARAVVKIVPPYNDIKCDEYSKRYLQFPAEEMARDFISDYSGGGGGVYDGLKEGALCKSGCYVYFCDKSAFGSGGGTVITHGGSHLLEMLTPLGEIYE